MTWHGTQEGLTENQVTLTDEIRNAALLSHNNGILPNAQGPVVVNRAGAGDEPNSGLRCPMLVLMASVLVQVYLTNLLVLHLCRLLVDLLVVVGH